MLYKKILLIDDDEDDHEIFMKAMEKTSSSVECIVINNAKDALRKLRANEIATDLIFLDLNMPIMNGTQFLKEIKLIEKLMHIPVIIYTTSSNSATIEETKELGATDFITKPDRFNDLVEILHSVID
jgi:DNA-binding NtrC family response regulator